MEGKLGCTMGNCRGRRFSEKTNQSKIIYASESHFGIQTLLWEVGHNSTIRLVQVGNSAQHDTTKWVNDTQVPTEYTKFLSAQLTHH